MLRRDHYISPSLTHFVEEGFWSAYWVAIEEASVLVKTVSLTEEQVRAVSLTNFWRKWIHDPDNASSWRYAAFLRIRGSLTTCSLFTFDEDGFSPEQQSQELIDEVLHHYGQDKSLARYDTALRTGDLNRGVSKSGFDEEDSV